MNEEEKSESPDSYKKYDQSTNVCVENTNDSNSARLNGEINESPEGILQIGGITGENNQVLWVTTHANQSLQ